MNETLAIQLRITYPKYTFLFLRRGVLAISTTDINKP